MEYPLVIETGETFLTHRTLLRHIREKCGDAVAEYLSGFLGEDAKSAANMDLLKAVKSHLDGAGSALVEFEEEINNAVSMMEKAGIE